MCFLVWLARRFWFCEPQRPASGWIFGFASSLDRFNKVRVCLMQARTCSECLAKSTCKCSIRCIQCTCHLQTRCGNLHTGAYLLGLLAMIKCSICSYQCDNWYVSNWRLACHIYFCWGSVFMSSLRSLHVLRWHSTKPVAAHPTRVTMLVRLNGGLLSIFL